MHEQIINQLVCKIELEQETGCEVGQDSAYVASSKVEVEHHEEITIIFECVTYGMFEEGSDIASARIPRFEVNTLTNEITEL